MAQNLKLTATLNDQVSKGIDALGIKIKGLTAQLKGEGDKQAAQGKQAADRLLSDLDKRERDRIRIQRSSIALEERVEKERGSIQTRASVNALRIERQASIAQASMVVDRFDRRIAIERSRHGQILSDLKGNTRAQEAELRRHASVVQRIQMDKANLPNTPFQRLLGQLGRPQQASMAVASSGGGFGGVASSLVGIAAPALAGAFAISKLTGALRSSIEVANQMNTVRRSLEFAAGGAKAGAEEFAFLRSEAKRLGFDLASSAQGFSMLSAAARGTSLEGKGARDIFSSVSEASITMGLSADQTSGALMAIQQMISKGTVQAEELRGQLGERLPGAFQIAARSMGVTTAELGKMLEQGQVLSDDFLPKFAAELHKTFGPSATKAAEESRASIGRFKNEVSETAAVVGGIAVESLGFMARAYLSVSDAISKAAEAQNKLYSTPIRSNEQISQEKAKNEALKEGLRLANDAKAQEKQKASGPNSGQQGVIDTLIKEEAAAKKKASEDSKAQVEAQAIWERDFKVDKFKASMDAQYRIAKAAKKERDELIAQDEARTEKAYAARAQLDQASIAARAQLDQASIRLANNEAGGDPLALQKIQQDEELKSLGDNEAAKTELKRSHEIERQQLTRQTMQMGLGGIAANLRTITQQYKSFSKAYKVMAHGQNMIDTYASATASYKAMAGIPIVGPGLGAAAAAVAVGAGLANASAINSQKFAQGTFQAPGGRALVGENGPEFVDLPTGAKVRTARETREMMGGGINHSGPVNINVTAAPGVTPSQAQETGRQVAMGYREEVRRWKQLQRDSEYLGVTA